jgi:hypothetical protein
MVAGFFVDTAGFVDRRSLLMQVSLQLIASRLEALSPLLTSQISRPPRAVLARRIWVLKVVVTGRYNPS